MSQEIIAAFRLLWPRHTSKHVARKWGRAVVTAKQWVRQGPPEYLLQTVLADLDEELAAYQEQVETTLAKLRETRETATSGVRAAVRARRDQAAADLHQDFAGC